MEGLGMHLSNGIWALACRMAVSRYSVFRFCVVPVLATVCSFLLFYGPPLSGVFSILDFTTSRVPMRGSEARLLCANLTSCITYNPPVVMFIKESP